MLSSPAGSTEDERADLGDVRDRILATASSLFYRRGVRAVGVDLIVAEAAVAKASLYRHFRTKDDLVVAFLRREDDDFWRVWDDVASRHPDDAHAELTAHLRWIGERVARTDYRGCPQLNVAAEFADGDHPARKFAADHKRELERRLGTLATRLGAARPDELASQLTVLINGAFVSSSVLALGDASDLLQRTADALLAAQQTRPRHPRGAT